ncbi:MAG: hypothetical protein DRI44_08530 [Chlamydiae bacterium]|nr:MAG: hypothetical protein DRI44_08530 [Chlamydiota bacterium]
MVSLKEKFRTQLLFIILMIGMIAALIRLFDLQCLRFEVYQKRALQQQQSVQRVKARRGRILDRNGKILAISSSRPAVWADPGLVKNVNKTAVKLSRVLNVQAYKIKKKLYNPQNPSNRFVWINKKISDAQAIALRTMIKKREIPGVYLKYVHNRIYPRDELLGNVLGFCNSEGNGAEGLEYAADNNLRGTDGYFVMRRDNRRNRFFVPEWVRRQLEPVDGNDIYLTIDEYIQHITELELDKAVAKYTPKHAVAIVMDLRPGRTGEILAMALWPKFNPSDRSTYKPGLLQNFATTTVFEPGSTLKIVTGAVALNEGIVTLNTKVFCENGKWAVTRGHTLHDDHSLGKITFKDVIKHSSNIGIAKTAQKLDKYVFYKYLLKFGFGKRTGIKYVPAESPGLLRPPSKWSKLSMISIPMGQEIGVTAIQLLSAVQTIASGGTRYQPTLLKKIETSNGQLIPEAKSFNYFEPRIVQHSVISEKASKLITRAMVSVTEKDGTGKRAAIPGYTVAGKTGTAQKYDEKIKTYSHRKFVASFVGFVPASNPAIAVLVTFDEPRKSPYGGTVSAPVFQKICKKTLAYLKIPMDAPAGINETKNK